MASSAPSILAASTTRWPVSDRASEIDQRINISSSTTSTQSGGAGIFPVTAKSLAAFTLPLVRAA
jgi:hypothetical protein